MYYSTARTAFMRAISGRWWWYNSGHICKATTANFTHPVCARLDPWGGEFRECMWSGLVDTVGLEDPKLFVWPGKGVFGIMGRKPSAPPGKVQRAAHSAGTEHVRLQRRHDLAHARNRALASADGQGIAAGDGGGQGAGEPAAAPLCPRNQPWLLQYLVNLMPEDGTGEWALPAPVPLTVDIPGFYDEQVRASLLELQVQIVQGSE